MELIDNAKQAWHQLWTVRLAIGGALVSAAETAVTFYEAGAWYKPVAVFVFCATVGIARVLKQKKLKKEKCDVCPN